MDNIQKIKYVEEFRKLLMKSVINRADIIGGLKSVGMKSKILRTINWCWCD